MDIRITRRAEGCPMTVEAGEGRTLFRAQQASADAGCTVELTLQLPGEREYLFIPACAYDGNRFETVTRRYPPMFLEEELGEHPPIRMTRVPALPPKGDGFMDVTAGDMAAPCLGLWDRDRGEGLLVFFTAQVKGGVTGLSVERRGEEMILSLRAPAKRRLVYRWYEGVPSLRENAQADPPMAVEAGEEILLEHETVTFPCGSVAELYRAFFRERAARYAPQPVRCLPFSAFWEMEEAALNRDHFVTDEGYYALNARDGRETSPFAQWQAGWVGGGMNTLALLWEGSPLSRQRAVDTLRFALRHCSERGFFRGIVGDGKEFDDSFGSFGGRRSLLLVRKQTDMVLFLFRQMEVMERCAMTVPGEIAGGAERAARALVELWQRWGQLGQFVNGDTGELVVGGSASGALAPAALCAAARVLDRPQWLRCAGEMGEYLYRTATRQGVTCGGPGEILQAPDSESAAALVESFLSLYEATGEGLWLERAQEAAHQLVSWVVAYDFAFPPESRFGRMGIRSAGSVWANVQNKHSAPGLCTMSPAIFLRLFRATGEREYLRIMTQIAAFIPQVVSRPDRPMETVGGTPLKWGEICERVNLSDWEGRENVGDSIFGASSWPECAMTLTWLEIPGLYAVPSRGILAVSDHVEAVLTGEGIRITNPTAYPAQVKVMVESEEQLSRPLEPVWFARYDRVSVGPGQSVLYPLEGENRT